MIDRQAGAALLLALALGTTLFLVVGSGGVAGAEDCEQVMASTVIDEPGCYELTTDLSNPDSVAIEINSSDVIFVGGGFAITRSNGETGIYVHDDVSNVTVENVTVSGFEVGVYLGGNDSSIDDVTVVDQDEPAHDGIYVTGSNNSVTNNNVTAEEAFVVDGPNNTVSHNHGFVGIGFSVQGDDNTLQNNTVDHTETTAAPNAFVVDGNQNTLHDNTALDAASIAVYVSGDHNTISDNLLTGAYGSNLGAIYLFEAENNSLVGNDVSDARRYGIHLVQSHNTTIRDTVAENATNYPEATGIYTSDSQDLVIENVSVSDAGAHGLRLSSADRSVVSDVTANDTGDNAIEMSGSPEITLRNAIVYRSVGMGVEVSNSDDATIEAILVDGAGDDGIWIEDSSNVTVTDSVVQNETEFSFIDGIHVENVVDPTVTNNTVNETVIGIHFIGTTDGTVRGNDVFDIELDGIVLDGTTDTLVFDNYLNNSNNVDIRSSGGNTWNVSAQSGTNVVGGPSLGGNFYATPDGDGFSETCTDADADGFCDTELAHDTDDVDLLPLAFDSGGAGADPQIALSPGSYDFGAVGVGNTSTVDVTVSNVGSGDLEVTGTSITGDAAQFSIVDGDGQFTVAPGDSRNVTVEFAPDSSDSYSASLTVSSNDTDASPASVSLTGDGEGEPEIVVSPTSHDFGDVDVGDNATASLTVANDGGSELTFDRAQVSGSGVFSIEAGNSTTTIGGGGSHTLTVEFAPTVTGVADATLTVYSDDADEPAVDVALSGNGTITEPDRTPVATTDHYVVVEDETLTIDSPGVLANDLDPDGDPITAADAEDGPSHGSLELQSNGSFVYTPEPGFTGIDTFRYYIPDEQGELIIDGGGAVWAEVTIEVLPDPNRAPVAVADHYSYNADYYSADWSLTVNASRGVLVNDHDPDGDSFIATELGGPYNGNIELQSNGSFVYTPDLGFTGTDSFGYYLPDEDGGLIDGEDGFPVIAEVTIEVLPSTNRAPEVVTDRYAVNADETLSVNGSQGVLANDHDPDGDSFVVWQSGASLHGDLDVDSNGSFVYTPEPGFTGTDEFLYVARDGTNGYSDWAMVEIEVLPPGGNSVPVAVADHYSYNADYYAADWSLTVNASQGVLVNDHDVEGDPFTASDAEDGPSHGSLELQSNGSFAYTPNLGFTGVDSVRYYIPDEQGELIIDGGGAVWAEVSIEVLPSTNRAPEVVTDRYAVNADETLSVNGSQGVLANDHDPDGDSFVVWQSGASLHGDLDVDSNGSFVYTPEPGFTGTDEFLYVAWDENNGYSEQTLVEIDVLPPRNRPPKSSPDHYAVLQGQSLTVDSPGLMSNDYDPDGDGINVTRYNPLIGTMPSDGSLEMQSNGSFVYTPDPGYTGIDLFGYYLQDEHGNLALGDDGFPEVTQVTVTVVDASLSGLADVSVAEQTVDFGRIPAGTNATATVTVANVGDQNLTVSGASLSGTNSSAYEVIDGNATTVLGYGATHRFTVEFTPTTLEDTEAILTVYSDDPDVTEQTVEIVLSGSSFDNAAPTINAVEAIGTYRDGSTVHTNGTVEITMNVTDEYGSVAAVEVALDSQNSNYQVSEDATYDETSGNWTVTLDSNDVEDDGRFDVVVTAADDHDNTAEHMANGSVVFDRESPQLAATVTRLDDSTANVTINATESLRPGSLVVDVQLPNGTEVPVSMTAEDGYWNGTISLIGDGQYSITATGIDVAGNRGTDQAEARLVTESTDNDTILVQMQPSGMFVRVNTDQPVNDTFVTVTERGVSATPLIRGQSGVKFLDAVLEKRLAGNLSYAVIGIPVDHSLLNPSTSVEDVTIRYFNETTKQWSKVPTTVENVTIDGTTDEYWIATVMHFSTYGAIAVDNTPPSITGTVPHDLDGHEFPAETTSETLRVEYDDSLSGVEVSRIHVFFDGTYVTADAATTVTSNYAVFEAASLTDGSSYDLDVIVEDKAGNRVTETVSFSVAEPSTSDEADGSSGGGGGPNTGDSDTTPTDIATPTPIDTGTSTTVPPTETPPSTTPNPTVTPPRSPTELPRTTTQSDGQSGFEVVVAILAMLSAVLIARRR